MTEKFTIKAQWFLPGNIENRIQGTLTFNPQEGSKLELYGCFEEYFLTPKFKSQLIILGITDESKEVTLFNCLITKLGGVTMVPNLIVGTPSTIYSIRYLLVGTHVHNVNDLVFNQISAEIFNLGEWINISGFQSEKMNIEKFKDHETTINYKLPTSVKLIMN